MRPGRVRGGLGLGLLGREKSEILSLACCQHDLIRDKRKIMDGQMNGQNWTCSFALVTESKDRFDGSVRGEQMGLD